MKYFYSPSTSGFYIEGVNTFIPDDVFEVPEADYNALFEGQSTGKQIVYRSRKLQLADHEIIKKTWDDVRARRDALLTACDWTQMPDAPLTDEVKALWRTYRQKLRDITEIYSDPDKVVWPLAPGEE